MAVVNIKLSPFTVPNFVSVKGEIRSREEGLVELPKFRLSELDEQVLSDLCDEFRKQVFLKAGKQDPCTCK